MESNQDNRHRFDAVVMQKILAAVFNRITILVLGMGAAAYADVSLNVKEPNLYFFWGIFVTILAYKVEDILDA